MRDEFHPGKFNRIHKRKNYQAEVHFSLDAKAYPAKIINISLGGALVENAGFPKISVGQVITINIPFQNDRKSVKRKAKVMWVAKSRFGIEFI